MIPLKRALMLTALLGLAACGGESEADALPAAEPIGLAAEAIDAPVEETTVETTEAALTVEADDAPAPPPGAPPAPAPEGGQSREAALDRMAEMFDRLDANRDGVIGADERTGGRGGGRLLERLDVDSDGAVTRAEMLAGAAARFDAADANGDGVLSEDERPDGVRFRPGPGF